jgi:uncharacterized protein (UPF0332 family)/predicted nucleotidyltransferase
MASPILRTTSELLNPARVPHLTADEREEVAQLLKRLQAECGQDVYRVILYGSKARGDAAVESDVDLLIVTKDGLDCVKHAVEDFKSEQVRSAEPQVFSADEYRDYQRLKHPFYVNTRRDGIELWDEGAQRAEEQQLPLDFAEGEFRRMDYETLETIRLYVSEAREKWDYALLIETDRRPLGALPLAYYAAFDWATAALYSVNVVRSKHKGVRDGLHEFLIKPQMLDAEFGGIYDRLFNARGWVDYGRARGDRKNELTDDEARNLMLDAERFNRRIEQFLRDRGALA